MVGVVLILKRLTLWSWPVCHTFLYPINLNLLTSMSAENANFKIFNTNMYLVVIFYKIGNYIHYNINNKYASPWHVSRENIQSFISAFYFLMFCNIQGQSTQTVLLWLKILSTKKGLGFDFIVDLLSPWVEVLLKKNQDKIVTSQRKNQLISVVCLHFFRKIVNYNGFYYILGIT